MTRRFLGLSLSVCAGSVLLLLLAEDCMVSGCVSDPPEDWGDLRFCPNSLLKPVLAGDLGPFFFFFFC